MVCSSASVIPLDDNKSQATDTLNNFVPGEAQYCECETLPQKNEIRFVSGRFVDDKGNFKFINQVVRRPINVFCFILGLCIAMTAVLFRLALAQGSPFTPDDHTYDLRDERSVAYDSFQLARQEVALMLKTNFSVIGAEISDEKRPRLQENVGDITYWIFEAKSDEGLLTEGGLSHIRSVEQTFINDFHYPNYCVRQYEDLIGTQKFSCRAPTSVTNIYYASEWNSTLAKQVIRDLTRKNIKLFNDLAACVLKNVLCDYIPKDVTSSDLTWVQQLDHDINTMMVSWNGEGTLNRDVDEVSSFLASINELYFMKPYVSFYFDSNFTFDNPVAMFSRSVIYWGSPLLGTPNEEKEQRSSDDVLKNFIIGRHLENFQTITNDNHSLLVRTYYFMGALIFQVILNILIKDGLKAIISFVSVFFYLRFMIGSWFLAIVGMLQIFLSLPLAWFVFSFVLKIKYFSTLNVLCIFIVAAIGADDIFIFMDAYVQSAYNRSINMESMETRMNWVFRRSGLAMLITSATTCSAFLCTLVSPIAGTRSFGIFAALVILFDYALVMTLYCTAVVIYHDKFERSNGCCGLSTSKIGTETVLNEKHGPAVESRINLFFRDKAAHLILRKRNRHLLGIAMVGWMVLCVIHASKLEPIQTTEQLLDKNHPIQRGATILNEKFPVADDESNTKIYFIWGLSDVNRDGVRQLFNPNYVGKPVFDRDFDFGHECQTKMLQTCDFFKTNKSLESLIKRKSGLRSVDCFIEELGAFNAIGSEVTCDDVNSGLWRKRDWQVESSVINSTMTAFVDKRSCYDTNQAGKYYSDTMGWDGSSLRYAGIAVESKLLDQWSTLPEDVVRAHYDDFMSLKTLFDSNMQDACQSQVIVTDLDQKFIFMNNQYIYRKSAISGSMIGVLIAFIVLLLATRKLHIASFATIIIACVLLSVIGSLSMMGWSVGTNEAILSSILAGFSVDYVVHLAHSYVVAHGSVERRIKQAFGEVGTSVFSGMLTSVVATIPLFMCTLTFFEKFGTFLCLTIAFSWLFANVGFMSLLAHFQIPMESSRFKWL